MKPSSLFRALIVTAVLGLAATPALAQRGHYSGSSSSRAVFATRYRTDSYRANAVWVPAGYELVPRRVFVPGRCERLWVEPLFELRVDSCGRVSKVCVRAGAWQTIQHPGRYELEYVRVWRPGHWSRTWYQ